MEELSQTRCTSCWCPPCWRPSCCPDT